MTECKVKECTNEVSAKQLCQKHYDSLRRRRTYKAYDFSPEARFKAFVKKQDGHWLWEGRIDGSRGRFFPERRRPWMAHLWAWVQKNGPLPAGKKLLNNCGLENCVKPAHWKLTNRLSDVCGKGHEYTEENTIVYQSSSRRFRSCRTCDREQRRARYERLLANPPDRRPPTRKKCKYGHKMVGNNIAYVGAKPYPQCRECANAAVRRFYAKRRSAQ